MQHLDDGGGVTASSPGNPEPVNATPYEAPTFSDAFRQHVFDTYAGNKGQSIINNAAYGYSKDPSNFVHLADGTIEPTAKYSAALFNQTARGYHGGQGFLQDLGQAITQPGVLPVIQMAALAATALTAGAASPALIAAESAGTGAEAAGIGAADAGIGAADAGLGAVDLTEPIAGLSDAGFNAASDGVAQGAGAASAGLSAAADGTYTGSQIGDYLAKKALTQGLKYGFNQLTAPSASGSSPSATGGYGNGLGGLSNGNGVGGLSAGSSLFTPGSRTQVPNAIMGYQNPLTHSGALDPANLATPDLTGAYRRMESIADPALTKEYAAMSQPQGLAFGGVADSGAQQHGGLLKGSGLIHGASGGRSDAIPAQLPRGGYVIPADVVSGLGDGNTAAGGQRFKAMIGTAHSANNGRPGFANGGTVSARVSAGEYFVHPNHVASIGQGDIDHGHRVLDHVVQMVRAKAARTAATMPPPAK